MNISYPEYFPVTIDIYNPKGIPVMNAQQGDSGRGIEITLTANGAVLIPTTEVINLYAKKPDKTISYLPCTVAGEKILCTFTNQMLSLAGKVKLELQIVFSGDGEAQATLKTPVCEINVCPSIVDNSAIESSNEFPALEDALAELAYYREHGLVGPPGEAATITVGDVEASVPGSTPQVTNSGTSQNAVLNFTLPRGEPGSVWYFGTAITGTETSGTVFPDSGIEDAKEYDKYVNTDTGNIYDCSIAGGASTAQWTYIGSIMGPAGATQIVFAAYSDFPETGDSGKIYVDTDTTDELVMWRWTGTEYVTTEHGALEMIADGLDPDESYVVNDYFIQGNKFRKVTTAFGPGEYDDSKTEVTTVAAELKSQNSNLENLNTSLKAINNSGTTGFGRYITFGDMIIAVAVFRVASQVSGYSISVGVPAPAYGPFEVKDSANEYTFQVNQNGVFQNAQALPTGTYTVYAIYINSKQST